MKAYELDQATRLHLAGILSAGHPEAAEPEPVNPWPPLSRAALAGGIPRAPRFWSRAEELEHDDGCGNHSPADHLPSRMNRGAVMRELRGMGVEW